MTAPDWDAFACGGDSDPQRLFGEENETPAALARRTLIAFGPRPPCFGQGDLFFGPDSETAPAKFCRERRAKALCAGCPARPACLEFALASGQQHGVWGGLDEEQLAAERRRQERAA